MAKYSTFTQTLTEPTLSLVTFAGIDYHKKASVVTLGDAKGNVLRTDTLVNDRIVISDYFAQFPNLVCAVESCRGYEWFVDLLQTLVSKVHLSNPYQTKLIAQSRCKTDKVDSKIIMQLLAIGFLPTCYLPTLEERELRERLRWRVQLVRYATRTKIKIHALIDKENLGLTIKSPFTKAGKAVLRKLELSTAGRRLLLDEYLDVLESYETRILAEDRWVIQTAKRLPQAGLLMTIPGIGALSALIILAELGDIQRFRTAKQVVSYSGLCPSLYSSADKHRHGRITKQGPALLRWILVQNAWQAIRFSPELRLHYLMVQRRSGSQAAILSLSRKLLKISFRVLRDQKPFDKSLINAQH